jgi:hypothetical protein
MTSTYPQQAGAIDSLLSIVSSGRKPRPSELEQLRKWANDARWSLLWLDANNDRITDALGPRRDP